MKKKLIQLSCVLFLVLSMSGCFLLFDNYTVKVVNTSDRTIYSMDMKEYYDYSWRLDARMYDDYDSTVNSIPPGYSAYISLPSTGDYQFQAKDVFDNNIGSMISKTIYTPDIGYTPTEIIYVNGY